VDHDGETYIRLKKSSYLIGLIGLEEMVHCVTGKRMHEDREAMDLGLAVTRYMDLKCRELTERLGLKIVLEQTPAESTAYRLARLDLKFFPDQASMFVKGDPDGGRSTIPTAPTSPMMPISTPQPGSSRRGVSTP
jgi:ribonucleoside-triphosphate reductase